MKTVSRILLLTAVLFARSAAGDRAAKLEGILRAQDGRVTSGGMIQRMLSDADSSIRAAAASAFGSLQDTSALPALSDRLSDASPRVQEESAFAIGQTAGLLSTPAREKLQHELIAKRLVKMSQGPCDRMIEEIGKFGSDSALNELVLRFGPAVGTPHAQSLVRSVARFAIRGVSTPESRAFLLDRLRSTGGDWQTAYALQRTGDHPEIRSNAGLIVRLLNHEDPLVRMNGAALLGKLKEDSGSVTPLLNAARSDPDWRVRVNALKALGNHDLSRREDGVDGIRRLFSDTNTSVAVTALTVFGTLYPRGVPQGAVEEIAWIAMNVDSHARWQVQAEAASALAKLKGPDALSSIKPNREGNRFLAGRLLSAAGATGAPGAALLLSKYLGHGDNILYRSALEGLQSLGEKNPGDTSLSRQIKGAAIAALSTDDMAVVTTAASILGDSLYRSPSSVEALLAALKRQKIPADVEAMQEIASTLGKIGDQRGVDPLLHLLTKGDRSVALAAAAALKSITGKEYTARVPKHFDPPYTDFDFDYLRSLRDTVHARIETSRGRITVELYKNAAPFTVMSFLKLAKKSFYRNLIFHRVVPNFVVQGGDPRGDGWGGPGYSIRSEFSALRYETGSVGIASAGRDTEGSQFFITQSPQPHLDGRYTLFGKVVSGMDVADKIQVGDRILDVRAAE